MFEPFKVRRSSRHDECFASPIAMMAPDELVATRSGSTAATSLRIGNRGSYYVSDRLQTELSAVHERSEFITRAGVSHAVGRGPE